MSEFLTTAAGNLRDPDLFAVNSAELTVLGASKKPLDLYSEKVFDEPTPEGLLPTGAYEPEVLHAMKATIFEVTPESVRLKMGEDVFVNVPKVVFAGKESALKYGQAVRYSIKRRANGFRFQDIDIDTSAAENPFKARVNDILASIPERK
jgi:cold shock CspA family protein